MWNFAVMGLGGIAKRVIEGIVLTPSACLYAVASRDASKAEAIRKSSGAKKAYGDYEAMLEDPLVDVVYICTPNYLHHAHIMAALAHHKHVICEKPLVSNEAQLRECFAYAKEQQCFLMEAEKTLFTPLNQKIKEMIEDGVIGKVSYIEGSYGFLLPSEGLSASYWGYRKEDGGCFYDVGVYPICYANYFADSEIKQVQYCETRAARGYVDFAQALITYQNGVIASVRSSWKMELENWGVIYGEKGYIRTKQFWKSKRAELVTKERIVPIEVEMESDFSGEIAHVCTCLTKGLLQSDRLGEKESMEIMKVLRCQNDVSKKSGNE